MSVEARALVLVTAVLLAFGLAVLYSASAIVAVDAGHGQRVLPPAPTRRHRRGHRPVRARRPRLDAERWSSWAWPLMGLTLVLLLVVILPFTQAIAPRIHGSRRFLFGASIQPSELAKLAVVVWTAMLVVRKGESLRGLTQGGTAVPGRHRRARRVDGDRARSVDGHAVHVGHGHRAVCREACGSAISCCSASSRFRCCGTRPSACTTSCCARVSFFDRRAAPAQVGYQLRQSLIAVGLRRTAGGRLRTGASAVRISPLSLQRFHRQQHRRGMGLHRH